MQIATDQQTALFSFASSPPSLLHQLAASQLLAAASETRCDQFLQSIEQKDRDLAMLHLSFLQLSAVHDLATSLSLRESEGYSGRLDLISKERSHLESLVSSLREELSDLSLRCHEQSAVHQSLLAEKEAALSEKSRELTTVVSHQQENSRLLQEAQMVADQRHGRIEEFQIRASRSEQQAGLFKQLLEEEQAKVQHLDQEIVQLRLELDTRLSATTDVNPRVAQMWAELENLKNAREEDRKKSVTAMMKLKRAEVVGQQRQSRIITLEAKLEQMEHAQADLRSQTEEATQIAEQRAQFVGDLQEQIEHLGVEAAVKVQELETCLAMERLKCMQLEARGVHNVNLTPAEWQELQERQDRQMEVVAQQVQHLQTQLQSERHARQEAESELLALQQPLVDIQVESQQSSSSTTSGTVPHSPVRTPTTNLAVTPVKVSPKTPPIHRISPGQSESLLKFTSPMRLSDDDTVTYLEQLKERLKDAKGQMEAAERQLADQADARMANEKQLEQALEDAQKWHGHFEQEQQRRQIDQVRFEADLTRLQLELEDTKQLLLQKPHGQEYQGASPAVPLHHVELLTSRLKDSQVQQESLEQQLEEQMELRRLTEEHLANALEDVEQLRSAQSQMQELEDQLQQELEARTDLEAQLADAKAIVESLQGRYEDEVQTRQSEVGKLQAAHEAGLSEVQTAHAIECAAAREEISELTRRYEAAELDRDSEVRQLQAEHAALVSALQLEHESQIAAVQAELREAVDQSNQPAEAHAPDSAPDMVPVQHLELVVERMKDAHSQMQELEDQLQQELEARTDLEAQLADAKAIVESLQGCAGERDSPPDMVPVRHLELVVERMKDAHSQLGVLEGELDLRLALEEQLARAQEDIQTSQGRYQDTMQRLVLAQSQLELLNREAIGLQQSLDLQQLESIKVEAEHAAQLSSLQSELQRTGEQLDALLVGPRSEQVVDVSSMPVPDPTTMSVHHLKYLMERLSSTKSHLEDVEDDLQEQQKHREMLEEQLARAVQDAEHWHQAYKQLHDSLSFTPRPGEVRHSPEEEDTASVAPSEATSLSVHHLEHLMERLTDARSQLRVVEQELEQQVVAREEVEEQLERAMEDTVHWQRQYENGCQVQQSEISRLQLTHAEQLEQLQSQLQQAIQSHAEQNVNRKAQVEDVGAIHSSVTEGVVEDLEHLKQRLTDAVTKLAIVEEQLGQQLEARSVLEEQLGQAMQDVEAYKKRHGEHQRHWRAEVDSTNSSPQIEAFTSDEKAESTIPSSSLDTAPIEHLEMLVERLKDAMAEISSLEMQLEEQTEQRKMLEDRLDQAMEVEGYLQAQCDTEVETRQAAEVQHQAQLAAMSDKYEAEMHHLRLELQNVLHDAGQREQYQPLAQESSRELGGDSTSNADHALLHIPVQQLEVLAERLRAAQLEMESMEIQLEDQVEARERLEEQLRLAVEDAEHWQCIYEEVCQSCTDEQEELKFLREELQNTKDVMMARLASPRFSEQFHREDDGVSTATSETVSVEHLEQLVERLKDAKAQMEAMEKQVEEQVEVRMLIEEQLVHAMQDTQHWHARYEQESTLRRQDHSAAAMERQRLQLELHTLQELLDRTSSLATPGSSRSGSLCAASRSTDGRPKQLSEEHTIQSLKADMALQHDKCRALQSLMKPMEYAIRTLARDLAQDHAVFQEFEAVSGLVDLATRALPDTAGLVARAINSGAAECALQQFAVDMGNRLQAQNIILDSVHQSVMAWIEAKSVQLPIADEKVVNDGLRLFDRKPGSTPELENLGMQLRWPATPTFRPMAGVPVGLGFPGSERTDGTDQIGALVSENERLRDELSTVQQQLQEATEQLLDRQSQSYLTDGPRETPPAFYAKLNTMHTVNQFLTDMNHVLRQVLARVAPHSLDTTQGVNPWPSRRWRAAVRGVVFIRRLRGLYERTSALHMALQQMEDVHLDQAQSMPATPSSGMS
uniref:Uncharacterized protein n=1 Tax=Eutreptiella gymnastica TaxID=73025 RepID=A0A6U8P391_9EUGL|mmetsp:Transcript_95361/g.164522  ORF Transcript_95361/g.164522 Transcript_95361/m.164522 type:complete len:1954 (+) Transcript_95361:121-5982(+)